MATEVRIVDEGRLGHIAEKWGWYASFGLLLVLLGFVALSSQAVTSLATAAVFGTVIFVSGIVEVLHGVRAHKRKDGSGLFHLLVGVLTIVVGVIMLRNPAATLAALTLLMAGYFISMGLFRIISALVDRFHLWGVELLFGCVSVLFGGLIFLGWPAASLVLIGLFVGLELLVRGFGLMTLALMLRRNVPERA